MNPVDLNGAASNIVNIATRVNVVANKGVDFNSGMFRIADNLLAVALASAELLLSIAIDVRRLRQIADKNA